MFEVRMAELEALARVQGLEFFPTVFDVVPQDIMTEIASYGLPTRARHWSYGKVYQSQRLYGTMGLSKIYEIVLNSDPCQAFLLDTNPDLANLLVAAHVFGHADFFTNNVLFARSNRQMVNDAVAHALRIDAYSERYGLETVERLMDIGFALDRHLDFHTGLARQPYPPRRVVEKERPTLPYDDFLDAPAPSVTYAIEGERLPPHPERDLLWFLTMYGRLEEWQRDVLQIIREESYYFYPQFATKILNEGWASYWHAELFHLYDGVAPDEMIEFARLHAGVVNPGGRLSINPYYLGYSQLRGEVVPQEGQVIFCAPHSDSISLWTAESFCRP
jgi:stage V sporulation protein R